MMRKCPTCGLWKTSRKSGKPVVMDIKKVHRRYDAGESCRDIAKTYECSPNTVRERLLKYGYTLRTRGEARSLAARRAKGITRK